MGRLQERLAASLGASLRRLGLLSGAVVGVLAVTGTASASAVHRPYFPGHRLTTAKFVSVPSRTAAAVRMGAKLVHPAPAGAQVTVTIAFRPRDPGLLARLAASSSARPGMSVAELRRLFAPAAGDTAKATRYLRGHGLNPLAGGILTRSFRGSVAAAESAFDTHLGTYIAAGTTFRSPTTSPQLPAGIAAGVVSVSGLDTYPTIHPAVARPRSAASPAVITASCQGPASSNRSSASTSRQISRPARATTSRRSWTAARTAAAMRSHWSSSRTTRSLDESAYQSCYGTSVPITDVMVNGGTTDTSGATSRSISIRRSPRPPRPASTTSTPTSPTHRRDRLRVSPTRS